MPQTNIWDSIEVDMNAEFDAVKVSLGDLKKIEAGLVVDLTSLYDNNVTLKVEGKSIASGSLVIVNDRYGVKIDKIYAKGAVPSNTQAAAEEQGNMEIPEQTEREYNNPAEAVPANNETGTEEEEFDYSDFELEDEGI